MKIAILLVLLIAPAFVMPAHAQICPERPACKGCGCKGGAVIAAPMGDVLVSRRFTRYVAIHPICEALLKMRPGLVRTVNVP